MVQKCHILFSLQPTFFYLTHFNQMKISIFLIGHLYTTTYLPILLLIHIANNVATYIVSCSF